MDDGMDNARLGAARAAQRDPVSSHAMQRSRQESDSRSRDSKRRDGLSPGGFLDHPRTKPFAETESMQMRGKCGSSLCRDHHERFRREIGKSDLGIFGEGMIRRQKSKQCFLSPAGCRKPRREFIRRHPDECHIEFSANQPGQLIGWKLIVKVHPDLRIPLPEPGEYRDKLRGQHRADKPNRNPVRLAASRPFRSVTRPPQAREDVPRLLPEGDSRRGQGNMPLGPLEEANLQLLLKTADVPGKRGLGKP